MKIVEYRDLPQKDEFLPLMYQAFLCSFTPQELENVTAKDERLLGPVGYCAIEKDKLAGFVGVMDIPTKTVEGVEWVGGIWCVATAPQFAHRGVCKSLMARAHEYFETNGYQFSFLYTSRTIIAYNLYRKLGYREVEKYNEFPTAYKLAGGGIPVECKEGLNWMRIGNLYEDWVADKTGFVLRQKNLRDLLRARKLIDEDKSIQTEKGYALISERNGVVRIQEVIAESDGGKILDVLLTRAEKNAEKAIIDDLVTDPMIEHAYESRGYRVQRGKYGVLMVRDRKQV
jgi:Predicted acetyltransferase involved in intracellular survival and related acetyltransferases